jgi:hypothetical protein
MPPSTNCARTRCPDVSPGPRAPGGTRSSKSTSKKLIGPPLPSSGAARHCGSAGRSASEHAQIVDHPAHHALASVISRSDSSGASSLRAQRE